MSWTERLLRPSYMATWDDGTQRTASDRAGAQERTRDRCAALSLQAKLFLNRYAPSERKDNTSLMICCFSFIVVCCSFPFWKRDHSDLQTLRSVSLEDRYHGK